MKRDLKVELEKWKNEPGRRPILLKGARQVGKSYLAKDFGSGFELFVEANFEFSPGLKSIFQKDLDPHRIIRDLSITLQKDIIAGKTLLFFDEIQECPAAVKSLRYFYEKMPELHVIAAGSLIDFVLEETGVPVGRVMPLYLYPFSFMEFLTAGGNERLREAISSHRNGELTASIHEKILGLLGEYMAVGGMPEAVVKWVETGNLQKCLHIHQLLIDTYRQDFSKYARKSEQEYVDMVFDSVPRLMGRKFIFSGISREVRSRELRPALDLLTKAGVVHLIRHTSANGLPLGAEVNPQLSKITFLDIALAQSVMGIDHGEWILDPVRAIANRGALTEAFVGQEILAYASAHQKQHLYYWVREKKGSTAEVDYVTVIADQVIPVEVKSGKTGSLKSINVFLDQKEKSSYGLHFSQKNYGIHNRIKRYPLYAIQKALS
ncbi:MAG: ATP-binding protein [bacterium]|nr:ATP-binding protein [bacterium]